MNKSERVLNHLKSRKTITSWEAIQKYRATRLADIVFRLKQKGHTITTIMCKSKDGAPYAKYVFSRGKK